MIEIRRNQLSFGDGLIAEEVSDLRESWMQHADAVLADAEIVTIVYEALGKRHPKSRSRGRRGVAAETVLRLLVLKHIRNWSYQTLNARCGPVWCTGTSPAWAPAMRAELRAIIHGLVGTGRTRHPRGGRDLRDAGAWAAARVAL